MTTTGRFPGIVSEYERLIVASEFGRGRDFILSYFLPIVGVQLVVLDRLVAVLGFEPGIELLEERFDADIERDGDEEVHVEEEVDELESTLTGRNAGWILSKGGGWNCCSIAVGGRTKE